MEEKSLDKHPDEHGGAGVFQHNVKHFTQHGLRVYKTPTTLLSLVPYRLGAIKHVAVP